MNEEYEVQISSLMDRADALADGETKVAILEEAIRLADTHQDIARGF